MQPWMRLMKAIVNHEYGSPDVHILAKVEKPTPKDNEVLIKVHEVLVNTGEWYFLTGKPFIIRLNPGGASKAKDQDTRRRRSGAAELKTDKLHWM